MKMIRTLLLVLLGFSLAAANTSAAPSADKPQPEANTDFLFVQSAKSMSFDKTTSRLTLKDVSPVTLFFSDQPQRIAGNMNTKAFIPFWSRGKNSFLSDPPNADVSILKGERLHQVVVELRNPVLEGGNLVYTVKILKGEMPASGEIVSVFIDVISMPLTSISYAEHHRRTFRRAALH